MTREQAKKALKEIGIEPTEEHVTKLLNTVGAEIQKEKEKGIKWAEKAAKIRAPRDMKIDIGDSVILEFGTVRGYGAPQIGAVVKEVVYDKETRERIEAMKRGE